MRFEDVVEGSKDDWDELLHLQVSVNILLNVQQREALHLKLEDVDFKHSGRPLHGSNTVVWKRVLLFDLFCPLRCPLSTLKKKHTVWLNLIPVSLVVTKSGQHQHCLCPSSIYPFSPLPICCCSFSSIHHFTGKIFSFLSLHHPSIIVCVIHWSFFLSALFTH